VYQGRLSKCLVMMTRGLVSGCGCLWDAHQHLWCTANSARLLEVCVCVCVCDGLAWKCKRVWTTCLASQVKKDGAANNPQASTYTGREKNSKTSTALQKLLRHYLIDPHIQKQTSSDKSCQIRSDQTEEARMSISIAGQVQLVTDHVILDCGTKRQHHQSLKELRRLQAQAAVLQKSQHSLKVCTQYGRIFCQPQPQPKHIHTHTHTNDTQMVSHPTPHTKLGHCTSPE
jgi:hypothetical protein